MQFKLFTAFLLVAACFVQVSLARPQEVIDVELKGIIDDLLNKAKEIWENIQNVVVTQIDKAMETFNKYKEEVINMAESALESGKQKIEEFIDQYKGKIDEIVAKAKEAGVDVQECVADNEQKFKDLFNHVWENEKRCVTKEIEDAEKIIDGGTKIMKDFMATIQAIPDKLSECGTSIISSIPCITKVIAEAVSLQASLPAQIYNKVQEVVVFMAGLQPRLATCAASQINGAIGEATDLVSTVGDCVAKKMEEAGVEQVSLARPQDVELKGIIDDLINKAKEIWESIQNVVVTQIDKAMETFNKYKEEVINMAESALESGKQKIGEFIDQYKGKIDEIVAKAKEAGVDVQECVADNEQKFKDLFNHVWENEKRCVTKEIEDAEKIINGGTDIMKDFMATIQEIPDKLSECGTSIISSIPCITKVIAEAVSLQASLPAKIYNKVQEVVVFMAGLQPRLVTCAASQINGAIGEATDLVGTVGECVAKKMEEAGVEEIPNARTRVVLRSIIDDMINKIMEIFENIQNVIVEQINNAMAVFEKYRGEAEELAESTIEAGKKQFEDLAEEFDDKAEDIVAKAEEQGVDVQDCVGDSSENFKNLFGKAFNNMKSCVTDEVEEAQEIIGDAVGIFQEFIATIQQIPEKAKKCGTSIITSIPCLTKVVAEAVGLQSSLPSKIYNKAQEVAVFMVGLKPRMATCVVSEDIRIKTEAVEVLSKLAECVGNKMGDQ